MFKSRDVGNPLEGEKERELKNDYNAKNLVFYYSIDC